MIKKKLEQKLMKKLKEKGYLSILDIKKITIDFFNENEKKTFYVGDEK